eukprot:UN02715
MLTFLHVQTTPLTNNYNLQPMLVNSPLSHISTHSLPTIAPTNTALNINNNKPTNTPPTTTTLSTASIFGGNTNPLQGNNNQNQNITIELDEDIYSVYTNGVEVVPITSNNPPPQQTQQQQQQQNKNKKDVVVEEDQHLTEIQKILKYCNEQQFGVPNQLVLDIILGHISNLCNHVSQRASLATLRQWKQDYKNIFSSPILFAKVQQLLQTHTFGLPARRFIIFELFGKVFSHETTFKSDIDQFMAVLVDQTKPTISFTPEQQKLMLPPPPAAANTQPNATQGPAAVAAFRR